MIDRPWRTSLLSFFGAAARLKRKTDQRNHRDVAGRVIRTVNRMAFRLSVDGFERLSQQRQHVLRVLVCQ